MKSMLLFAVFALCFLSGRAQDGPVDQLPAGRYETLTRQGAARWEKGDLLLQEGGRYRLSAANEGGDYRFSAAAQKIFFTSGPLKGAIAKTSVQRSQPTIVMPYADNQNIGVQLAPSDVVAVWRSQ